MGEAKRNGEKAIRTISQAIGIETPGGRIQVGRDAKSTATPFGRMAFFIEFLMLTGLYAKRVESCPLSYSGPRSSKIANILGTWLLSVLSGHRRQEGASQGWEGREGEIKPGGWDQPRRICALRRPLVGDVLLADEARQLGPAFVESECPSKRYEYAVPVTDLPHNICALAQLYRDRCCRL